MSTPQTNAVPAAPAKPAWVSEPGHWTAAQERISLRKMLEKRAQEDPADPLAAMAKAVKHVEEDLRKENDRLRSEVASLNTHYGWAVKHIDALTKRLDALEGKQQAPDLK